MAKKYAQILDGKVHYVYVGDKPKFPDTVVLVEVTDQDPQLKEGWTYDPDRQTFHPPTSQPEKNSSQNKVFLNLTLTKDKSEEPFSLLNDGKDSVNISIALFRLKGWLSEVLPYDGPLKLKFESGGVAGDVIQVTLVDGVATIDYTTTMPASIYTILGFEDIVFKNKTFALTNVSAQQLTVYRIL